MTALSPIAESEQQLLDLVAHHIGTVTGLLTPECAAWILKLNTSNRPLSPHGVDRFRAIASSGQWKLTGEPIVIAREGLLNDGQHRCHAVVATGVSVPVDVRFGAPRDSFLCTGTGRRRTAAQALHILGMQNVTLSGSIARMVTLHDAGALSDKSFKVENAMIASAAQAEPSIGTVAKVVNALEFAPIRAAAFGFPMVLAARVAPFAVVLEFIDLAASGLTSTPHNAARTLHLRLMDARIKKHRLLQIEVATLTARAWNLWVEGKEIKQLKVMPEDRTGSNFPRMLGVPA